MLPRVTPLLLTPSTPSVLLDQLLETDDNLVVAAPTGSGKTMVHELAILRLLQLRVASSMHVSSIKVIMIAPNKALCQQRMTEWLPMFGTVGLTVVELTGDTDASHVKTQLAKAHIVVTTPEKWDSITRTWKDNLFLLGCVDLLLIDEVHHLGDDRGATLEVAVVRMKTVHKFYAARAPAMASKRNGLRFVALSATLPNLADIGKWLDCTPSGIHFFDESFRPVPLTVHVEACGSESHNTFLFEKSMDKHVQGMIQRYAQGKQTLVFCASKSGCEKLAALLAGSGAFRPRRAEMNAGAATVGHLQQAALVAQGTAYHHAGLSPHDRSAVERLFLSGCISVLACTSTLAHGVNLPARLVVIKGTNCWRGGGRGYEQLPKSAVLQMVGRAGRPGMDDCGVAVIMTSTEQQHAYAGDCLSADIVESQLLSLIQESLCAEISQTVITDVSEAIAWLKETYFYVRVRKNPRHYGITGGLADQGALDDHLNAMCLRCLQALGAAGIVEFGGDLGYEVRGRPEATIMTTRVIRCQTMVALMELNALSSVAAVLAQVSTCMELHRPLRRGEKKVLNALSKHAVFRPRGKVQGEAEKVSVLLQAYVHGPHIDDFFLRVQQTEMAEAAVHRILPALQELAVERRRGGLLLSCLMLRRALDKLLWTPPTSLLLQCEGLADSTYDMLSSGRVATLGDAVSLGKTGMQQQLGCSAQDATALASFVNQCRAAAMDARLVPLHTTRSQACVEVGPRYPPSSISAAHCGRGGNSGTSSASAALPFRYCLVAYRRRTGALLLWEAYVAPHSAMTFNVSGAIDSLNDVVCALVCTTVVGMDSGDNVALTQNSSSASHASPTPRASVSASGAPKTAGSTAGGRKTSKPTPTTRKKKAQQAFMAPTAVGVAGTGRTKPKPKRKAQTHMTDFTTDFSAFACPVDEPQQQQQYPPVSTASSVQYPPHQHQHQYPSSSHSGSSSSSSRHSAVSPGPATVQTKQTQSARQEPQMARRKASELGLISLNVKRLRPSLPASVPSASSSHWSATAPASLNHQQQPQQVQQQQYHDLSTAAAVPYEQQQLLQQPAVRSSFFTSDTSSLPAGGAGAGNYSTDPVLAQPMRMTPVRATLVRAGFQSPPGGAAGVAGHGRMAPQPMTRPSPSPPQPDTSNSDAHARSPGGPSTSTTSTSGSGSGSGSSSRDRVFFSPGAKDKRKPLPCSAFAALPPTSESGSPTGHELLDDFFL